MTTSKLKKAGAGLAIGGTMLVGGTAAENAAFEAQNQYEERIERVADERIEVRDRITDASVRLERWGGEEALTIKRQKDQSNIPFLRLMDGSRKEQLIATSTDEGFQLGIELLERPDTNRFCYAVEGENLNWYKQLPLWQEAGLDAPTDECTATDCNGAHRPENVVNSFAVYHATKKNHVLGETNYETGKAFHRYRAEAVDADGNRIWGDSEYQNGEVCDIIDPEWLDGAKYPVKV